MDRKLSFLISVFLLTASADVTAQQVSVTEAQSRAYDFLQQAASTRKPAKAGALAPSPELSLVYTSTRQEDGRPLYYAFNQGHGQGFVIVGGDETARRILAYSPEGDFDPDNLPDNFRWWLSQYDLQISRAIDLSPVRSTGLPQSAARRSAQSSSRHDVPVLIQTAWDQSAPYWNDIPVLLGYNNFLTGCVATATAQVMKYHAYPEHGFGYHEFTYCFETSGSTEASADPDLTSDVQKTFSSDFSAHTYHWSAMTNTYTSTDTGTAADEVAQLMYDCGVAVDMMYGTSGYGGSGAYSEDVQEALVTYFGYDASASCRSREVYSDEDWEALIYDELANNRPVIYGGASFVGGHEFICDGYDAAANLFHFNWGWSGQYNAYCPLTGTDALTPGGAGSSGASAYGSFSDRQDATIHIMPDKGGVEQLELEEYNQYDTNFWLVPADDPSSEPLSGYDYSKSQGSKVYLLGISMLNFGRSSSFRIGVKAVEKSSGTEYVWDCGDLDLERSSCVTSQLPFDLSKLTYNGIYEISPVARISSVSGSDWEDVRLFPSEQLPTITMTGGKATEAKPITFTLPDASVEACRTLQIGHDETYTGEVTYTSLDPAIATVDENGLITGITPGYATIRISGAEMLFDGNVLFTATSTQLVIEVTETTLSTPEIYITHTTLSVGKEAYWGYTGGYDGTPVLSSSDEKVATVNEDCTVTALSEGTATITISLPATNTWAAASATYEIQVVKASIYLDIAPYFSNGNNPSPSDDVLHISLVNGTSSYVTAKVNMDLYSVSGDGTETLLASGTQYFWDASPYWPTTSSYSISQFNVTFNPDQKYRIRFTQDDDGTPWNIPSIDFTYREDISIVYELTSAGIGTLILPFDAQIPESWKAYTCPSLSSAGYLNLVSDGSIRRNVPYIIMGEEGTTTFTGPNAIEEDSFTEGRLVGALTDNVPFQAGDYILQNQNGHVAFYPYYTAHKVPNNGYCPLNRAFIRLGRASADNVCFEVTEMGTSAIEAIHTDLVAPQTIYDLRGNQRSALQPGLNIVSGHKVLLIH